MRIQDDYQFNVSVSKDAYKNKKETKAALANGEEGKQERKALGITRQISFYTIAVTPQQLLEYALNGHTFCAVHSDFPSNTEKEYYTYSDGYYSMKAKSSQFFAFSNFIGIDIDQTSYPTAHDFIAKLSLKPTFWYTSLRNQKIDEKTGESLGARFRLIYVFDTPIRGKYFFRFCASRIYNRVETDTEEQIHDDCGLRCSQYFNGTNRNSDSYNTDYDISNIIYSFEDIDVTDDGFISYLKKHCDYTSNGNDKQIEYINCILNSQMIIYNNKTNIHTIIIEREKSIHTNECIENQYDIQDLTAYIAKLEKEYVPEVCEYNDIDKLLIQDAKVLSFYEFKKKYMNDYPLIYRKEEANWETFYDE